MAASPHKEGVFAFIPDNLWGKACKLLDIMPQIAAMGITHPSFRP
jgi:hypothetical protein